MDSPALLSPATINPRFPAMKRQLLIPIFVIAQLILLMIEIGTHYDANGRQIALAITNVVASLALLWFNRWLAKRGGKLSWLTIVLVAVAIWLDALGNFQHLYGGFWWWDRLTHTVGGMALSTGFIDLFLAYRTTGRLQAGWTWTAWMGFLAGQLVGSLYEISEWLGDFWFHTQRVQGPYDTPRDLFKNLVGGLLVLGLMWIIKNRKS